MKLYPRNLFVRKLPRTGAAVAHGS